MHFNTDFYALDDNASGQLLRRASNKSLCQFDAGRIKKLFVILTYIFREYSEKQEGFQEVIKANLDIFLIELVRHRKNAFTKTALGKKCSELINDYIILEAKRFLIARCFLFYQVL